MDVDGSSNLKRSNSAPSINEPNASVAGGSSFAPGENGFNIFLQNAQPLSHRPNTSGSLINLMPSYTSPKIYHRIKQLRQEETIDMANREIAHEKELHSAMQISQSWEDLSTMIVSPVKNEDGEFGKQQSGGLFGRSSDGPLHSNVLMDSASSSPSPTRSMRHCVSPSLFKSGFSPIRNTSTSGRSSFSMRPSMFESVKRKCEMDDYEPIPKKWGLLTTNNKPEPMQVASIIPTTKNATLVSATQSNSSGNSSTSNFMYFFEPLQTLKNESKSNSQ